MLDAGCGPSIYAKELVARGAGRGLADGTCMLCAKRCPRRGGAGGSVAELHRGMAESEQVLHYSWRAGQRVAARSTCWGFRLVKTMRSMSSRPSLRDPKGYLTGGSLSKRTPEEMQAEAKEWFVKKFQGRQLKKQERPIEDRREELAPGRNWRFMLVYGDPQVPNGARA